MRVAKPGTKRERPVSPNRGQKKSQVERGFSAVFFAEQVDDSAFDLVMALEEIDEFAKRLRESPVLENLLRYKKKVRVILRFLVEQSYNVQERTLYDVQGRRRLLVLVESIDQKLEELTREFLNQQSGSLDLVSRLDEIRGLLLDLQV